MSGEHYTIEDVTDDEIQYIQDHNEVLYFDLEFPDPFSTQLPDQYDQIS